MVIILRFEEPLYLEILDVPYLFISNVFRLTLLILKEGRGTVGGAAPLLR